MPIDEKILQYGQKGDLDGLHTYMATLNTDELVNIVKLKLSGINFAHTWNYVLQGFTETSESHKQRFKVVRSVLQELEKKDMPSTQVNAIIHRLCMELLKFKPKHLIELCNFCVECIQSKRHSHSSWKELLPEISNVIVEKECVEHNDAEMSGIEFKHNLINSLCMIQWNPNMVTSLTSMFIDMPLSKDEHIQVVNKLTKYIEKLLPQEIPSFIYQLLKFAKYGTSKAVFLKLQNYFGLRVYEQIRYQTDSYSESTDLDSIDTENNQEVIDAESTVLFHIHSSASLGCEGIKDYILSLKHMLRSPEFILHPFQLTVLLTISTISHYEESVFEIIRACISRTFHEEQKKLSSAWFRDMMPRTCKVEEVFTKIIRVCATDCDRELVFQGLVNFAFSLLNVGASFGREMTTVAEKRWTLGNMILLKIIKRKRHVASTIIMTLSNHIITGNNVSQYIECMYILSRNVALLMLENKSIIISLMEGLVQMPGNNANQLLDAIIPLTKVSPTIRDHFIILLRKALYSRVTETRQMAVNGFLKLLTNLEISNMVALSQTTFSGGSFSSGHSLFTQISVNRMSQGAPSVFSNEALCLEVLSILGRCFMQQAEVRAKLYEGLYDTVCLNPELGVPVLNLIWSHFSEFYNIDENIALPLKFGKVTARKDVNVFLREPLGKLIYTIGLITNKVNSLDNENSTAMKFFNIMDSLSNRMINCELVHFDLDDGTDLLDIMPESQEKLLILAQAMLVYEALIGYQIMSWEIDTPNCGQQISNLFLGYSRLLTFAKNLSKPKKADGRKKKGDKDTTTQQTANQTTTPATKKDNNLPKTSKGFKVPDSLLGFQVLVKTLSLLHEPMVTWTSKEDSVVLKSAQEFHRHIMKATLHAVNSVKQLKTVDSNLQKVFYDYLCEIAIILYERIIKRLEEFVNFDCQTAMLALDCFLLILNLIDIQFKNNIRSFLAKVGGRDKEEDIVTHLTEFVKTYQKLFELDEEETSSDVEIKKMALCVVNTLSFFSVQIPVQSNTLSVQLLDWLKSCTENNTFTNRNLATSFINLVFETHIKFKASLTFLEQISIRIGDVIGVIDEEVHDIDEFKVINELTVNNIVTSLCNTLKSIMDEIDWTIARLTSEYWIIIYPGEENTEKRKEYLKTKERGICCHLCFLVNIMSNLSNCAVSPGPVSEVILKSLSGLYNTLSSLAKYFILRSTKISPVFQGARFERLIKLAGKQLAPVVYKLIMYIEESQKTDPATQGQRRKRNIDSSVMKSKVLKETRLIPKVVYEMEQFSKFVIQLSNKTKIDLSKFMGQGTVRDFRIMGLKEVLEQAGPSGTQVTQESDESAIFEDAPSHSRADEEQGEGTPPKKKPRQ